MNLNITMGQYYPVDSFVHRLDPRTKILLTVLMIVAVFMVHSLVGYALVLAFLYWAAKCSNVPFKMLMKGIKPLHSSSAGPALQVLGAAVRPPPSTDFLQVR